MTMSNVLNIRIVTPVSLTEEQGETGYYAALGAVKAAIPDLTDEEDAAMTDESSFGIEALPSYVKRAD